MILRKSARHVEIEEYGEHRQVGTIELKDEAASTIALYSRFITSASANR